MSCSSRLSAVEGGSLSQEVAFAPATNMSSGTSTPADQQPAGSSRFTSTASSLSASLIRARPYRFSTQVVTVENPDAAHKDQHGSSSVPIYQTATFKGMGGSYDYSRSGNPTRTHLGTLCVHSRTRARARARGR